MAQDLPGTLAAIASMGYSNVEFAGYYDYTPGDIPRLLKESGLSAPSAHVAPDALLENPELTLDAAATAGHKHIVLAWWEQPMQNPEGYRQLVKLLNRAGLLAQERGLSLAYHNHDFEFSSTTGWVPYDFLLRETDPAIVSFELDLYWAVRAGRNPIELLTSHHGRFPLMHAKDMDSSGCETDVGSGQIDFASIFDHLSADLVSYIFVERDEPETPLKSAAHGLKKLREMISDLH